MTVIEIHKDRHMELAGQPWKDCLAAVDGKEIRRAEIAMFSADKATATEPVGTSVLRPHLAVDHVWLREIGGRAFLYLCNY